MIFHQCNEGNAQRTAGLRERSRDDASISPLLTRNLSYSLACLLMACQQHQIFRNEGRERLTAVPSMETAKQQQPLSPVLWHQAKGRHQWRTQIQNSLHVSEDVRETEDRALGSTIGSTVYFFSKHENHGISKKVLVEMDPGKEHPTMHGIRWISEKEIKQ